MQSKQLEDARSVKGQHSGARNPGSHEAPEARGESRLLQLGQNANDSTLNLRKGLLR